MPVKIMRTLRDISDEVSHESLSTQPLLTDDYTYGNVHDVQERLDNQLDDAEEAIEESPLLDDGLTEEERLRNQRDDDNFFAGDPGDCGCNR